MIAVVLALLCAFIGVALYAGWRKRNPKPLLYEAQDSSDQVKKR
jgi:hypothetical protein